jgi:xanthine dehydrogenase accessory factor
MGSQANGEWEYHTSMRHVLSQLTAALDDARPIAVCQLVETRGSTPQKAGAMMLVFTDGSQAGTLGGGCVEAEVKRRAVWNLEQQKASVENFELDHDYGWDTGLICGGRMKVFIDPLSPARDDGKYYRQLAAIADASLGATQAIVFDSKTDLGAVGSAKLFDADGRFIASRDQAAADLDSIANLVTPLINRPAPYVKSGIAFLPLLPRVRLLIVGGGHVGQAVARLAAEVDFDVWVVDDRESIVSPERFPTAEKRMAGDIEMTLRDIQITPKTYCLIVTRGHQQDERALFHLADRGAGYVGLIGSRRKIKLIFDDLAAAGVPRPVLDQVHAPVGLDIGSQSVPEIAISIVAQLIAQRNRAK